MKKIIIILILFIICFSLYGKSTDPNEKVIYRYYELLCSPDTLKNAYDMSPKKASFETFKDWYKNVVIVFVKSLKKNNDGTYTARVHIGEYLGENSKGNEVSAYEVIMKVSGGKIVESKSSPLDFIVEETLPYKNQEILIADDIKQNAVIIYLNDKKIGKKQELKKFKYDRFGININSSVILSDLLLIEFNSFDYFWNTMIDLKNNKEIKGLFTSIYISPNKEYIFSYGDNFMTGGGIALEVYNGKVIGKKILSEDYCVSDIQFYKKDSIDYIKFKTEDINQRKDNKVVNLTEIVNKK